MSYKKYEKHSVTYQLIEHINKFNEDNQSKMDENPNLWIGRLTNDPDHWADYGVYTPEDFERYLDNEAKHCQEKEARTFYGHSDDGFDGPDDAKEWEDFGEVYDDSYGDYI